MPTINKSERKKKSTFHNETDMRKLRRDAYNKTAWKNLRLKHIMEHPLCERCLRNGRVTPARQVHHIKSPFTGGNVNWKLFLDDSNLESICPQCHGEEHGRDESPEETISRLDALLNN